MHQKLADRKVLSKKRLIRDALNSVEEFGQSFGPQAAKIIADLPNFTNIEPVVQINEVIS